MAVGFVTQSILQEAPTSEERAPAPAPVPVRTASEWLAYFRANLAAC